MATSALFNPLHPFDLPLLPPSLAKQDLFHPKITRLVIQANRSVSELNGTCRAIPNAYPLLMNIPVLQETVSSSAIEGIHTTIQTLLEAQVHIKQKTRPVKEVLSYREALHTGFKQFKKYQAIPTRSIKAIHREVMPAGGGEFKTQTNKIAKGGSQVLYTPPAPIHTNKLMGNWENYIHSARRDIDPLIKTAISHYQFEAIHPFSDGNGRTGRILIVLQMLLYKLLDFPILYISGYLLQHRQKYYSSLLNITKHGRWMEFIRFFLMAFDKQAQVTNTIIINILNVKSETKRILKSKHAALYSADFLDHVFSYPVTHATFMGEKLNITYQTAGKRLARLEKAGLLKSKKSGTHKLYYNFKLLNCLKT